MTGGISISNSTSVIGRSCPRCPREQTDSSLPRKRACANFKLFEAGNLWPDAVKRSYEGHTREKEKETTNLKSSLFIAGPPGTGKVSACHTGVQCTRFSALTLEH